MALTTFTRPGAVNSPASPSFGDRRTHNLVLFAGEVLEAFRRKQKVAPTVRQKTIPHGKSASFVATGRIAPVFHTPGNSIIDDSELKALDVVKRPVYLDDKLVATTFVDEQESDMNEWEERGPIANQLGEALADQYDEWAHIQIGRAARWNATNLGGSAGTLLVSDLGTAGEGGYVQADMTDASTFYLSIQEAAAVMDAKDVPDENRFLPLTPADYWLLLNNKDHINRDYGNTGGVYSMGEQWYAAGFRIMKTNNLPQVDVTASALGASSTNVSSNQLYGGNFTRTNATTGYITTAYHSDVIGQLTLRGIELQTWNDPEYQGDFYLAKIQSGINVIRPESAVELNTAVTQPGLTITP